jgi:hypothetical protein
MNKYVLQLAQFCFGVTNAQKNDIAPQDLNGIRAIVLLLIPK